MASSVGMRHDAFKRQLREHGYLDLLKNVGFDFQRICGKSGKPGRPKEFFVFAFDTAKVLLAQSRTAVGLAYLAWLFKAEKAVYAMAGEISRLRLENEQLRLPKRRVHAIYKGIDVTTTKDIFGKIETTEREVRECKRLDEMDENDKRAYLSAHLSAIAEGCAKKVKDLQRGNAKVLRLMPKE